MEITIWIIHCSLVMLISGALIIKAKTDGDFER